MSPAPRFVQAGGGFESETRRRPGTDKRTAGTEGEALLAGPPERRKKEVIPEPAPAEKAAEKAAEPAPADRLPVPVWLWIVFGAGIAFAVLLVWAWNWQRHEVFKMLLSSFFPLALLILAVLGSIVFGLATPTEAAAVELWRFHPCSGVPLRCDRGDKSVPARQHTVGRPRSLVSS